MYYQIAFSGLLDFISKSRNLVADNSSHFSCSKNELFTFSDPRFESYKALIEKYETNARSLIEALAVSLVEKYQAPGFSLYPVDESILTRCPNITASQLRKEAFELIHEKDNNRSGIAFYININDAMEHYRKFKDDVYNVDSLTLVWIADPDKNTYDALITKVNEYNQKVGIAITRVTIKEFWLSHFGSEEYTKLTQSIADFNEKAHELIGFDTVITPTDEALDRFRNATGETLQKFPYSTILPSTIAAGNITDAITYYLKNDLWKIMLTKKKYAISFISSEWYYKMYQLTSNLDLTGIVAGYIKSVEQLLFAVFASRKIAVKDIHKNMVQFSGENAQTMSITLGSLESALSNKQWMIASNIDHDAYLCLTTFVRDWNDKYRKKLFHRDNLTSVAVVEEVRNQAILLYAVLLGSIYLNGSHLAELGYFDK